VLGEACRQARAWVDAGTPVAVAVNLTAREFQQPGLADEVATALANAGLDPAWLRLEITESLAMRDAAATAATLGALRALGVRVAIDDFGTGHSSLASLKSLPVDTLKIDRAFVHGMTKQDRDRSIVSAILSLARALRLKVIAEGVETEADATILRDLGCHQAQGYFFSRPVPLEKLEALLKPL
jgi:EAL domain-containing protein (putative c-di-GMP-specific phosphodiesterase class I)